MTRSIPFINFILLLITILLEIYPVYTFILAVLEVTRLKDFDLLSCYLVLIENLALCFGHEWKKKGIITKIAKTL